jgi:pyroglutamyl-peptidase
MAAMPTILLTAFEPFAGADCNPSARVADSLARETPRCDVRLVTAILPVVAAELPNRLEELLQRHEPHAVIGLGEARGTTTIRIEHRAVNRLDFRCDNSGASAADRPIVLHGRAEQLATLNVDMIVSAVQGRGIACERSESCGAFCCNQLLYHTLRFAERHRPRMMAGFVHLPSLPGQRVAGESVTLHMSLDQQVAAVRIAIEVTASQLDSVRTANGRLA